MSWKQNDNYILAVPCCVMLFPNGYFHFSATMPKFIVTKLASLESTNVTTMLVNFATFENVKLSLFENNFIAIFQGPSKQGSNNIFISAFQTLRYVLFTLGNFWCSF